LRYGSAKVDFGPEGFRPTIQSSTERELSMDARRPAAALLAAAFTTLVFVAAGASYRTPNFVVEAETPELAQEIGRMAEHYRHDLAIQWLGAAMPNWTQPCPIHAQVAPHLGAGGQTSFTFDHSEVFGWHMEIQGSHERLLDSVLPHEVTHTIFASHFRRPLPRWADEGGCTTVEDISERSKQDRMLIQFLMTGRGIAFNQMFAMTDYPQDILPLYAQGYSLAKFLIDQHGQHEFLTYLNEGMSSENWSAATYRHYGYRDLGVLQSRWLDWVKQGSPVPIPAADRATGELASNSRNAAGRNLIVRAQASDRSGPNVNNVAVSSGETQWSPVARHPAPVAPPTSVPPTPNPPAAPPTDLSSGVTQGNPIANTTAAIMPVGKSVYGDGVGIVRHSAEMQNDAASAGKPASVTPPAAPPVSTSASASAESSDAPARKVLLQWNRQQ
jgi:hypothetical protein